MYEASTPKINKFWKLWSIIRAVKTANFTNSYITDIGLSHVSGYQYIGFANYGHISADTDMQTLVFTHWVLESYLNYFADLKPL